jgi:fermentation-respiration switch protein FrsA (DUF1100 family)
MFRDVISPAATQAEWGLIREEIHARILATMGDPATVSLDPQMECLGESLRHGVRMRLIRFTAVPGFTTYGTLVIPAAAGPGAKHAAVLCMHGTDPVLAHQNVLSPEEKPNRQYAIELAQRGLVALAVDQFAFGEGNGDRSQAEVVESFYAQHPNWSLDGVRLWIHQRAIDILSAHESVDASSIGCIGHSLGGRTAVYLAAFDQRIKAAVPSAGISPNVTNIFRNPPSKNSLSPRLDAATSRTGIPPFEYQELLSLITPRSVLLLEPWNDTSNPMIEPVFRCFEKARFAFQLCGASESLQILCHGDGHDTRRNVRNYAYAWLEEKLTPPEKKTCRMPSI